MQDLIVRRVNHSLRQAVALAVGCAFCGAAVAIASAALTGSAAPTTIQACESTTTGQLRVVSNNQTQCVKGAETPISWMQQGIAGATGARGPTGATGPTGSAGASGKTGASNIAGVQKLPASAVCANGGWRIITALGSYSICDGSNGKNATGGS